MFATLLLILTPFPLATDANKKAPYYAIPREYYLDRSSVLTTANDDIFEDSFLDQVPIISPLDQGAKRFGKRRVKSSETGNIDHGANITRILRYIRRNNTYDRRIRPNYKGRRVTVGVSLFISDISHVSEVNMDVTLDFYFRQFWRDPRLDFQGIWDEEIVLGGLVMNEIWRPDTFFVNAKQSFFHQVTQVNTFLRITPLGIVTQSLRLTVLASCPMDFTYFPMDSPHCRLEIESYGYTMRDIAYRWRNHAGSGSAVQFSPEVHLLPQFQIRGHRELYKEERLSTGNYSRLTLEIIFDRSLGYYVIQVYVPSSLIVVLSILSFWIDRDQPPGRVTLGITTVLTMRTVIASTNAALPKISYLKAIDVYLVTCFFIVVAALIEYAAVTYTTKRCKMMKRTRDGLYDVDSRCLCCRLADAKASDIEKYSRIIFPVVFAAFNVAYWLVYLNFRYIHHVDEQFIPAVYP